MKRESNNHSNLFGVPIPSSTLMDKLSHKFHSKTYTYGGRPFGVGLLVIYYDGEKSHLFELNPAGEQFEYNVESRMTIRHTHLATELSLREHTSKITLSNSKAVFEYESSLS